MTSRVATALGFILAVVGLVALPHTAGAARGIRVGQAAPEITGGPWVNSDKKGVVRYTHIGEGAYRDTEDVIRRLLAEP